jgi:hypothetical protein
MSSVMLSSASTAVYTHWSHNFHKASNSDHLGTLPTPCSISTSRTVGFSASIRTRAGISNRTDGRSTSQRRYSESGAFQLLMTRRSASVKRSRASEVEYYIDELGHPQAFHAGQRRLTLTENSMLRSSPSSRTTSCLAPGRLTV